jgi:hypothetical protein
MDRLRDLRMATEQFVRDTFEQVSKRTPSKRVIKETTAEIVRAMEPVVLLREADNKPRS